MAKSQSRSNREIRKPKKSAAQRSAETASSPVKGATTVAAVFKTKR